MIGIHDLDIERYLLGYLVSNPNDQVRITRQLSEIDFYLDSHIELFTCIKDANDKAIKAEYSYLISKGKFSFDTLSDLTTNPISMSGNYRYWITRLRDLSIKREIKKSLDSASALIAEDKPSDEIIDQIGLDNLEARKMTMAVDVASNTSLVKELEAQQERARKNEGMMGIPLFGIKKLDKHISGGEPSDLIIVAGRPGMGKSVTAVNAMLQAVKYNYRFVLWTLEMSGVQYLQRLIAALGGGSYIDLRRGVIRDRSAYDIALSKFQDSKIQIIEKGGVTIDAIRSALIGEHEKKNIDVVFIDHLGLIQGKGSLYEKTTYISNQLKVIAKELKIPVVALSQLNRSVESRGGSKRPHLSDLRDSGSIEQDADKVILVHRPKYYDAESFERDLLIIEKNRGGESPLDIKVDFKVEQMLFIGDDDAFENQVYDPTITRKEKLENVPF